MLEKKVVLALAALVFIRPALAAPVEKATPPVTIRREVTLEGLLREVTEKNPGLRAKKKEYEAARAKVTGAFLPEDPEFGVDVEGQKNNFKFSSRMNFEYMAQQKIPFPTKLLIQGAVAAREADIAYQKYKEEERQLIWHVEQPYYELFLTRKTISALEENQKLLEQLLKSVKARYEAAQTPQTDLLKVQIESSKNSIEIFDQMEKLHIQESHFSHNLNVSLETRFEIIETRKRSEFNWARADLDKLAISKRPELKMLEQAVARANAVRALVHSNWLPDITFKTEARQFRGEGSIREYDNFVGVSVPVWSLFKGASGGWAAASDEVEAAEDEYLQMKNEVLLKAHEAFSKVKAAENALVTYENLILPLARQQIEISLAAYEAGRGDFLNLIDAQRMLRDIQIDYARHVAEYEMGFSDLRLAVGDDLIRAKAGEKA